MADIIIPGRSIETPDQPGTQHSLTYSRNGVQGSFIARGQDRADIIRGWLTSPRTLALKVFQGFGYFWLGAGLKMLIRVCLTSGGIVPTTIAYSAIVALSILAILLATSFKRRPNQVTTITLCLTAGILSSF